VRLKQLQYFQAVAEELHFSRAAARLHIAQPPLSQQIRKLEKELKAPLFERTNRTVRLTPAGEVLYRETGPLLMKVESLGSLVRRAQIGQAGRLTIAFSFSAAYTILPLLVRVFMERFPDLELDLREMHIELQLEALMAEKIDVGILRLPVRHPSIMTQPLQKEALVVALPAGHSLARKERISLKDLASVPLIAGRNSGAFYDSIKNLCRGAGFEPMLRQEASDLHTVLALVSVGLGLTLVPETMKASPAQNVVFKYLRENPMTELAVAWKRDNSPPVLQNFLQVARELTGPAKRTVGSRKAVKTKAGARRRKTKDRASEQSRS